MIFVYIAAAFFAIINSGCTTPAADPTSPAPTVTVTALPVVEPTASPLPVSWTGPVNDYPTASKNLIVNGSMNVDQNYGGTRPYESLRYSEVYGLDQWRYLGIGQGAFTLQQVNATAPGFTKALRVTVTHSQSSIANGDNLHLQYPIEGRYLSDLAWGTPHAKDVTLSFWVKYSQAGTKSVALLNGVNSLSYVTTFDVHQANVDQFIELVIPGPQTGSWSTTANTFGMKIIWSFGMTPGNSVASPTNGWVANDVRSVMSADQLITEPVGSTFEMTGVQLEIGTHATAFDVLTPSEELQRLQRYYLVNPDRSVTNKRMGGL